MKKLWQMRWIWPALLLGGTGLFGLYNGAKLMALKNPYLDLGPAGMGTIVLSLVWLVSSYGLARKRFWARGFALGLLSLAAPWAFLISLFTDGLGLLGWGHALALLALIGPGMRARYERNPEFLRSKQLDAGGARRLFIASVMLGVAVPILTGVGFLAYLGTGSSLFAVAGLGLAFAGVAGFFSLRGWSLFLLLGSAVLTAFAIYQMVSGGDPGGEVLAGMEAVGLGALLLSTLPFLGPVVRFMKGSAS